MNLVYSVSQSPINYFTRDFYSFIKRQSVYG